MTRLHAKEGLTRLDANMHLSECDDRLLRCLIAADGVGELDDLQTRPGANKRVTKGKKEKEKIETERQVGEVRDKR